MSLRVFVVYITDLINSNYHIKKIISTAISFRNFLNVLTHMCLFLLYTAYKCFCLFVSLFLCMFQYLKCIRYKYSLLYCYLDSFALSDVC